MLSAVEDAGFDVSIKDDKNDQSRTQICELKIQGMVCSACSNGIKTELERLDGVHHVQVALTLGEAEVEYDGACISIVQSHQVIE